MRWSLGYRVAVVHDGVGVLKMAEVSSLGKWENVEEKEATQETELAEVEI